MKHSSERVSEEDKLGEFLDRDRIQIISSKENMRKVIEKSGGQISEEDDVILDSSGDHELANNGTTAKFNELTAVAAGSRVYIEDALAGLSDYLMDKIHK